MNKNIKRNLVCKYVGEYDKPFNVEICQFILDEKIKINGVKISVSDLQKIFKALNIEMLDWDVISGVNDEKMYLINQKNTKRKS